MKKYLPYLLVAAFTFLICFLVDLIARRGRRETSDRRVRPQRRTLIFGVVISFLALVLGLQFLELSWLAPVAGGVCLLLGIGLILVYFGSVIVYDDRGFTCRSLWKHPKHYCYADITGERALLARSGVNAVLFLGQEQVYLYQSMQGVNEFLRTAYEGYLAAKGLSDADFPAPNPGNMIWFPEPPEE
jgi:hypothetical protein